MLRIKQFRESERELGDRRKEAQRWLGRRAVIIVSRKGSAVAGSQRARGLAFRARLSPPSLPGKSESCNKSIQGMAMTMEDESEDKSGYQEEIESHG